jgi:hypothetical protein
MFHLFHIFTKNLSKELTLLSGRPALILHKQNLTFAKDLPLSSCHQDQHPIHQSEHRTRYPSFLRTTSRFLWVQLEKLMSAQSLESSAIKLLPSSKDRNPDTRPSCKQVLHPRDPLGKNHSSVAFCQEE